MSLKWFCDRCNEECEADALNKVHVVIERDNEGAEDFHFAGDVCRSCSRALQAEVEGRFHAARQLEAK